LNPGCFGLGLIKKCKMGNVLNGLILILFFAGYAILVVPAFVILLIADAIKGNRYFKMSDPEIMQNLEA